MQFPQTLSGRGKWLQINLQNCFFLLLLLEKVTLYALPNAYRLDLYELLNSTSGSSKWASVGIKTSTSIRVLKLHIRTFLCLE